MSNFQNKERLISVSKKLDEHRDEIGTFYHAYLDLQVDNDNVNQLIKDTFACSVSERRGASLQRGHDALVKFEKEMNNLFGSLGQEVNNNPSDAHKQLFEKLCRIQNIDQKIAAMFLKFMVVYLHQWQELKSYLFVPIDSTVIKILRDRLQVYTGSWKQSPGVKNPQKNLYVYKGRQKCAQYRRYLEFQEEYGDICKQANVERILADELWLVGHIFCKELPLCNRCWISEWCQGKNEDCV